MVTIMGMDMKNRDNATMVGSIHVPCFRAIQNPSGRATSTLETIPTRLTWNETHILGASSSPTGLPLNL